MIISEIFDATTIKFVEFCYEYLRLSPSSIVGILY